MSTVTPYWWPRRRALPVAPDSGYMPGSWEPVETLGDTDSAPLDEAPNAPPRREGWEHEPINVPHNWLLYGATFLLGLLGATLGGCATTEPREPGPAVWASCPPLPAPMTRTDGDAYTRRIAAVEGWYLACQQAAPQAPGCAAELPTPPAHNIAAMQRLYLPVLEARYAACRESALTPRAAA